MTLFSKIAVGALLALPLVLQSAFAQQSTDAARARQQGIAQSNNSTNPPAMRTGDGQVVPSSPPASSDGGGGSGKK